jgi:hypothetical protein
MPFRIIKIDRETDERIVSSISFATLEEATTEAAKGVDAFEGEYGFDAIGGYWWLRDESGKVTHIYVND